MLKKYTCIKNVMVAAMLMVLTTGCSSAASSVNNNSNKNNTDKVTDKVTDNTKQNTDTEQTKSPDKKPATDTKSSQAKNASVAKDSSEILLSKIMELAKSGKVINCEFADKINVDEAVKKKWGEPDKTEWISAAKGTYLTYSKHNIVFGINKGAQIFEVRSFDSSIKKISLSKVKKVFGAPAYDVKSNGQEIIGYVVTKEFKILMVFPLPKSNEKDPLMEHYSVLYPQGTVNSMASDPGRKW